MSIERRPDANRETWRVRWREGGKARGRNFRTYDAAVAFEADRLRRRELGAFAPVLAIGDTLAEWLTRWQVRYGPGWSETTRRQRRWILSKHVIPAIGHVPLRDLGPARVREFRDALIATGASARTVNAVMSVLSAALGRAAEEGLVPVNPARSIRSLPAFRTRPRALSVREVESIRAAMPTPRDRLIVSLLAYAGLRPAEAVALVWENVSAVSLIVDRSAQYGEVVPTKTRKVRAVAIEQPLGDDLERVPRLRSGLVVPGVRGGLMVWRNFVRREWQRACERAGVAAVPYDLRHTYASAMLYSRPVHEVSAALGHASASMTLDTYAHVLNDVRLSGPADLMAEALAERRLWDAKRAAHAQGRDGPGLDVAADGDGVDSKTGCRLGNADVVGHGRPRPGGWEG